MSDFTEEIYSLQMFGFFIIFHAILLFVQCFHGGLLDTNISLKFVFVTDIVIFPAEQQVVVSSPELKYGFRYFKIANHFVLFFYGELEIRNVYRPV